VIDIRDMIARGEDETIEFKRSLAETEDALHTLSAFASQRGGTVAFGIGPSGRIVGIDIGPNTLGCALGDLAVRRALGRRPVTDAARGHHLIPMG
jgi:predicted HTH transcriptional regulator